MIREAKGIAIHDLSFWSDTLPLLDGLTRILREYRRSLGMYVYLSITASTARIIHDETLDRFIALMRGDEPSEDRVVDRLADGLLAMMVERGLEGSPAVNVPVSGCGIVIGGSCDLLWYPVLLELKLTAKEPSLRDVRQLLVYAGLIHLSHARAPSVGIVANPRLGVYVEFDLGELLMMTGGLTLDEFSGRLADFLVSSGQSN
jgi:hypothetical protein